MRLALVVNPAAGGGRGAKLLPALEKAFAGHDVTVSLTTSLEHGEELARAAVADDRVVVAVGGDGLVGRVAGAVATARGVLGVVPGGRGNDFCRSLGIRSVAAACDVVLTGVARPVDVGVVDGVPFLGIASVGFDSDVQERVLRTRVPLGQLVYLWAALATVRSWRDATFTLEVDGAPVSVTGWSAAVSNSGVYGGGMRLAPDASVTDGSLDLVTTSSMGRLAFLRSFPKVFRGTHVTHPAVDVRPARSVTLSASRPFRVFADGDPVATLPCTVTVLPGALQLLLPR